MTPRRLAGGLCGVLALLLAIPASMALTVRPPLVDSGRFVATFAPLAQEPSVQEAVAAHIVLAADPLVDSLAERVAATSAAGQLAQSAATITARSLIQRAATTVTESDTFATVWQQSLTLTYQELVGPLASGEDGTLARLDAEGALGIDIAPVVAAGAQKTLDLIGVSDAGLLTLLPEEIVFPLFTSETLAALVRWAPVVAGAGVWLPVLAGVSAVSSVLLASRRRRACVVLGSVVTVAGVAVLLTLLVGRHLVVARTTIDPPAAVGVLADALTGGLRLGWLVTVLVAAAIAAAALVLGRRQRTTES